MVINVVYISRCIDKDMHLEMPKQLIIWNKIEYYTNRSGQCGNTYIFYGYWIFFVIEDVDSLYADLRGYCSFFNNDEEVVILMQI